MVRIEVFLRLAVFFIAFAGVLATLARAEVKVGDAFPSLSSADLVNLAGGEIPETKGTVALVDFWASWCAPCQASFPAMAKLHAELGAKGLQIVAISIDEKPAAAAAFRKKMNPPFVTLHDPKQKLVEQVAVPTMPTSYLLDRSGRVRSVHTGFHGDLSDLRREIEKLLAEAAPSVATKG